jgi:hypothetical protein
MAGFERSNGHIHRFRFLGLAAGLASFLGSFSIDICMTKANPQKVQL